jgi:hypothetical protein
MRKTTVWTGGLVAAASATLLLVGLSPALASPALASTAAKPVTGPESITGTVHGKAATANVPNIPLSFTGVVATTDHGFELGGSASSNTHTLTTPAGKLTVTATGQQEQSQTLNPKTCWTTYTVDQQITFVASKSTGKFAGASGPGAYQVYFGAYLPRYTSGKDKGQCNTSNNAQPLTKGAVATFLAAGVLTTS